MEIITIVKSTEWVLLAGSLVFLSTRVLLKYRSQQQGYPRFKLLFGLLIALSLDVMFVAYYELSKRQLR